MVLQAPSLARAEDQAPPPGPPPPYQVPPPGSGPPVYGPQPSGPQPSGPPPYAPPGYGPPGYGPQPYAAPSDAPEEMDFDETKPIPPGYTKVSRARKGLIIGGACTLGGVYLFTTLVAAAAADINKADGSNANVTPLYLPVFGPFLELGQTDSSIARFYLTLSGLGQTAGAIMLIYGLASPKTLLVRNDQLTFAPMIGNGASGLSVMGRF